jgi:aminopeptidase N
MVDLDAVRVNFDGITYAKGASALRQLVAWVGEEEFLRGIQAYFVKHAWGNTELNDLFVELEAASGRDLSGWSQEWLQTSGVNLMRADLSVDTNGNFTSVAIVQEPPTMPEGIAPTLRSHRMAIGLYDQTSAGLIRRDRIELDVIGARTDVPQLTGQKQPDLLLLNDDDLTFTKTRLDERSWRTAMSSIGALESSMPRALIWGAAWDMTRDAEVSTGDYLELYLSGIPRETDIGVVQTVMRQLRTAIDLYAAPEHIEGYTIRLADALWAWAQESEAGSDRQLAFVRGLTATATTPAQIDIVAGLLAGSTTLPGLVIDTDLRWSLLQRLAAKGRADLPEIEQELARDATATGQRQAAIARACRPTPEAKELAWADLAERDDMPNAMIESTIMGFQQGEPELLLPFRARYFGSLKDIWERRTAEMAQDLAVGLYPALLVSADTLSDTDAFLADESLHPSLRRLVSECRDGVARALRCRVRDAR